MKRVQHIIWILMISLIIVSCTREPSESVDQDKIWVKYDMIYDKNEDQTTVRAEFRFGGAFGTKLELSPPAYIRFNGSAIPYNSTFAYYEDVFPGLVSSGAFEYKDVEGFIYSNATDTIRSVEFEQADIVIQQGVDYVLNFVGQEISGNDVVTVNVSDKIFATSISGATSLTLGGSQTSAITAGPYIGTMTRTVTRAPVQATSEGGTIWLTHKAFNKAITIQ